MNTSIFNSVFNKSIGDHLKFWGGEGTKSVGATLSGATRKNKEKIPFPFPKQHPENLQRWDKAHVLASRTSFDSRRKFKFLLII